MAFNSVTYFLFLPIVYVIFHFTADRWRWLVLFWASYGFYAALKAPYLLAVLFMVTCISYACGLRIAALQDEAIRKRWLWIGSFACIAILCILKYLPFLESRENSIFGINCTLSKTLIMVGVSYYTFQAISYLADVYLELEKPEKHFGLYALYLAFFPKLLQGPIERVGDLLPQLKEKYEFNYDNMRSGMLLFTWGLFKKVVIADGLGLFVDPVYKDVHAFSGLPLLIATYAYAFQIYMDFSGYTDMALGSARLFNINLTQNFNSPYLATSVADFWRRWHITFSRWILDYIFKPLQMQWRNWKGWGTAAALIVAFLVSGMWHGASWGFVIWGALHGLCLACSVFYRPYQRRIHKVLGVERTRLLRVWQIVATFNMVSFTWIFFRAANVSDAWYVIKNICNFHDNFLLQQKVGLPTFIAQNILLGRDKYDLTFIAAALLVLCIINYSKKVNFCETAGWFRWSCYYLLIVSIIINIIFIRVSTQAEFIYFKF